VGPTSDFCGNICSLIGLGSRKMMVTSLLLPLLISSFFSSANFGGVAVVALDSSIDDDDDIFRRQNEIISSSSPTQDEIRPMPSLPRPSLESVLRVTVIAPSKGKSPTCAYSLVQLENVVSLYNYIFRRGLQSPPFLHFLPCSSNDNIYYLPHCKSLFFLCHRPHHRDKIHQTPSILRNQ